MFSADETDALSSFLEENSGNLTAEEISQQFAGGKFTARQINGKALSLEMTGHVKPAEKKATLELTQRKKSQKSVIWLKAVLT